MDNNRSEGQMERWQVSFFKFSRLARTAVPVGAVVVSSRWEADALLQRWSRKHPGDCYASPVAG